MRYAADGRAFLASDPAISTLVAVGLAERLNFVTTYLADLKHQYGDAPGLSMIPDVLRQLAQRQAPVARPGSARDPDPDTERLERTRQKTVRGGASASARRRSSAPIIERQTAEPAARSISMWAGTGPIWCPALKTQVSPMRSAQAPSGLNGGWCTWPLSTRSGRCCVDPVARGRRRHSDAARPAGGRPERRPVVDPHPARGPAGGVGSQLLLHVRHAERAVPPRTDGDQGVAEQTANRRRSAPRPSAPPRARAQPARPGVRAGEVVVARAHGHVAGRVQQREILQDDDGLRVERNRRADVEVIAGQHHEIERRRAPDDPVELGSR